MDSGANSAAVTVVAEVHPAAVSPISPVTDGVKVHQRRVVNKTTGEVSVRPTVIPTSIAMKESEGADPLDKSLSSAFFQNLRKSGDAHAAKVKIAYLETVESVLI